MVSCHKDTKFSLPFHEENRCSNRSKDVAKNDICYRSSFCIVILFVRISSQLMTKIIPDARHSIRVYEMSMKVLVASKQLVCIGLETEGL